jgi:hypothetical protein
MCGKSSGTRIEALAAALLFTAGLLLLPASAFGFGRSFGGSYKTYLDWIYDAQWQGESSGIADNILRLDLNVRPADPLSVELAYVLYPEIRSTALQGLDAQQGSYVTRRAEYRFADPERRLLPVSAGDMDNIGLYQDIDRAVVTLRLPFADLYAGRQAVSWGSARVVNPTDILVPFRFLSLDTEYRKGVDALRIRVPFAGMSEIDAGYVAGQGFRFDQSAVFARTRLYVLKTDCTISGMIFRNNLLVGLDLARAVGQASAWLEGAWVVPDLIEMPEDPLRPSYAGVSAGVDYNFKGGLYGYLEYYFNSAVVNDPHDYLDILLNPGDHPAYSEGNVYLLGRHYLCLGGSYSVTPLLPVSCLLMVNLNDLSADLSISAEYNIRENFYLAGGVFLGLGPKPDVQGALPVRYKSEFGAYPDLIYTAVKAYF